MNVGSEAPGCHSQEEEGSCLPVSTLRPSAMSLPVSTTRAIRSASRQAGGEHAVESADVAVEFGEAEIARAEKINPSYVSRVLRLTLLAPDLVEALVGRCQKSTMSLRDLMKPFPIEWNRQR
jgi:hypothetical protein